MTKPISPSVKRSITLPKGFSAAGTTCGVKPSGKPDLAVIAADKPCAAAAVFTTNAFKGAPVLVGMDHLKQNGGYAQAIVCNSGNANVATLAQGGLEDAIEMCAAIAKVVGCAPHEVLPASTGVIGRPLPIDAILTGIGTVKNHLGTGEAYDTAAAEAILTTDLVIKTTQQTMQLDGHDICIGGIGKGSGMIAPSMATMLIFFTTDVDITPPVLQEALAQANRASFSRISVDTDTSTSDTVYILASGAAGNPCIDKASGPAFEQFTNALSEACRNLADQVICDGEGATRTFEVRVLNAASIEDADRIGRAVTDSPLVKCAIHGCDPNWGRLVMAAGKSGAKIDPDRFTATIEGVTVFEDRQPTVTTPDALEALSKKMHADRIHITLDIHAGNADATWLGCDLSRDYIRINADYTT